MKYDIAQALHECQLLSARIKRTRTDYSDTDLHIFDSEQVNNGWLFDAFSKIIIELERKEAKLIQQLLKQQTEAA